MATCPHYKVTRSSKDIKKTLKDTERTLKNTQRTLKDIEMILEDNKMTLKDTKMTLKGIKEQYTFRDGSESDMFPRTGLGIEMQNHCGL